LEIIKAPAQFYVLVNAADGHVVNRAWLQSIAMDTAMMKRCIVHRITQCGAVEVFKSRYTAQAAAAVNRYGKQYADDTFQQWMKFVEMPQQNHHLLLDELAADAPPPDVVQMHPADRFPPPPRAGLQQPPMIGPRRCAGGWVVDDEPRKEEGAGGLCTG
jgi:hypothetical protein